MARNWPGLQGGRVAPNRLPRLIASGRSATFYGSQLARLAKYLSLPGVAGNYASTPDNSALSALTGDLDLRCKIAFDDWTPGSVFYFMSKAITSGQYAWDVRLETSGKLMLRVSKNGTTLQQFTSSVATGVSDGATKWVRATFDSDDGGGNRVCRFYLSDDGETWTQLGTDVSAADAGATYAGTDDFSVGAQPDGNQPVAGSIFYAEVRNGIDGPIVASFDPTRALTNQTQIQSATGEVWTINTAGGGQIAQLF